MCRWFIAGAALLAAAVLPGRANTTPLEQTRSVIEQWVQTRQITDRTRADWERDRALVGQAKELYVRQLADEEARLARIGTNVTQAGLERRVAEQELAAATNALQRLGGLVTGFEDRVRALAPRLPEPLQPIVQPFLNRLPTNAATTRLSVPERLQTVVGFLNEVDKFNGVVTVADEKRPDAAGQPVSVEVIYLGLGAAYYADATGEVAGYGEAGPGGWQWTAQPGIAPAVRDAVAMYRNAKPAAFVNLPAVVR